VGLIDAKAIQEKARKELADEQSKKAVEKLKELYQRREKAALVVKNIDREIELYLQDVSELVTYEAAGVDVTAPKKDA
jgi:hypothetical protein